MLQCKGSHRVGPDLATEQQHKNVCVCRECVCVYITESFCCTAEVNTTLQVNHTAIKKNNHGILAVNLV